MDDHKRGRMGRLIPIVIAVILLIYAVVITILYLRERAANKGQKTPVHPNGENDQSKQSPDAGTQGQAVDPERQDTAKGAEEVKKNSDALGATALEWAKKRRNKDIILRHPGK